MVEIGFLGTGAPLFMDIFMVVMVLLPILIGFSIWQAVSNHYGWHIFIQKLLFFISLMLLPYVAYQLDFQGIVNSDNVFYFFLFHVIIAITTLIVWGGTLKYAKADRKRRALPGLYSKSHRKLGKIVAFLILLTSISGVLLYWRLFVA